MAGNTVAKKLGFECKLYIGTASAAPSTEAKGVTNVSVTLTSSAVDATTRLTGKFKTYIAGMIDGGISFRIHADSNDAILTTLRTQWLARGAVAAKVELGDGYYFMSDMVIDSFSNSQANEEIVAYDVTLKPTVVDDSFLPTVATGT